MVYPLDSNSWLKKINFSREKIKLNAVGVSSIQMYILLKADKV